MPKQIQISVTDINGYYNRTEIAALCDDGSMWIMQNEKDRGCTDWQRLPDIPTEVPDYFRDGEQIPRRM